MAEEKENKNNVCFKIKEAILKFRAENPDFKQIEIAKKMYPDCAEPVAAINFSRLVNGKKKSLTVAEINFLCKELKTTPNFLCGWTLNKSVSNEKND